MVTARAMAMPVGKGVHGEPDGDAGRQWKRLFFRGRNFII